MRDNVRDEVQDEVCGALQDVRTDTATGDISERELVELFSAFSDLRASDSLKEATLSRIFAEMDAENSVEAEGNVEESFDKTPQLTLLAGGKDNAAQRKSTEREPSREHVISLHRRRGMRLRVAAAFVVAALGLGGGAAYALPSSHVLCSTGDTTFDLGVNLFGITVSAKADSNEGSEVLEGLELAGERLDGALEELLDACEERGDMPVGSMTMRVRGSFADDGHRVDEAATRILDERVQREASIAPQAEQALPSSQGGQTQQAPSGLQGGQVSQDVQTSAPTDVSTLVPPQGEQAPAAPQDTQVQNQGEPMGQMIPEGQAAPASPEASPSFPQG